MTEPDAGAREIGFRSEADLAAGLPLRALGIAMDLSEALPLPDGMHFDVEGGHLVPPALAAELRQDEDGAFWTDILRAYDLQPWHIGLAPPPPASRWRRTIISPLRRPWLKITRRW